MALRKSEERFREMFNHMGNGVIIYEGIEDGNNFIIKDINKAGEQVSKVSRIEIIGKKVTEIFPGIRRMGLLDRFQRVWETGIPESASIQVLNLLVDSSGGNSFVIFLNPSFTLFATC